MDESELERKAVEELLKEANRAKIRAETMGTAGWMKCPLGSTNKRFLLNTLGSPALRQPRNPRASERGGDRHGYRTCEKHRIKDCEKCSHRKDNSHRGNNSHSSKPQPSSRSGRHSPHLSRRTNRTRSRSPVRDSPAAVPKYTDERKK